MKSHWILYLSIAFLFSCQNNGNGEYPQDLDGKKALLVAKKESLDVLESEIAQLTEEIAALDPSLKEKARLVSSLTLIPQSFERYIKIQGSVIADEVVNVVSEVPGRILDVTVQEGDAVEKGMLIATLDLESINRQITEVQTALTLANDVYERQSRLWSQNIGSEIQYLEAKNNKERLEKNLETLSFQLSKSKIYAPISGIVDREVTKAGELASPGAPIVQILNVYKVKVEADLPERYLKIVRTGQPVQLTFPSIDLEFPGRINLLGRTIDPANRTLKLEIGIQGRSRLLKPNLLTEIKLKELTIKDAIVVPVEFILQEVNGREFVYLVNDSGEETRAKKVYIESGEAYEGMIAINEGLTDGDRLVTKGSRNISDGELIQIVNNLASAQ